MYFTVVGFVFCICLRHIVWLVTLYPLSFVRSFIMVIERLMSFNSKSLINTITPKRLYPISPGYHVSQSQVSCCRAEDFHTRTSPPCISFRCVHGPSPPVSMPVGLIPTGIAATPQPSASHLGSGRHKNAGSLLGLGFRCSNVPQHLGCESPGFGLGLRG